jgi:hypothetical protein
MTSCFLAFVFIYFLHSKKERKEIFLLRRKHDYENDCSGQSEGRGWKDDFGGASGRGC